MSNSSAVLGVLLVTLSVGAAPAKPTLVIVNGRLAEGSGAALQDGRVVVVAGDTILGIEQAGRYKAPAGARVIDARGLVVAPGFIDTHSHADGQLLDRPGAETQVRQGITTFLGGQDGGGPTKLGAFLAEVEKKGVAVNVAMMMGHGSLREEVLGRDAARKATPEELARMRGSLVAGLRDGAFGLSSGLEYEPGSYSDTAELVELARSVKEFGGFYISHVRDEGREVIRSYRELIEIAAQAGIPAQITHAKLGSRSSWGLFPEYAALMKDADARGLRITADCYPYDYWQSTLRVLVLSRRYEDRDEVVRGVDDNGGPENIVLATYAPDRALEGKTLAQIASEKQTDPYTLYMELIRTTDPARRDPAWGEDVEGILGRSMREEDIRAFYADPRVMVSSDGGIRGAHPRGAGAFPRFLGRYVREAKVVSLAEGVRRMTSLPASVLKLADRGRIAPGMKADLVLFDPETVTDRSTPKDPWAAPAGIPWVLVNGQVVVENGTPTDARPGRALRAQR